MVSNMAMVLLVLAIVYILLLVVTLTHTRSRLFTMKDSSISSKVFKAFYAFIMTQILLTDVLYWVYLSKIVNYDFSQGTVTLSHVVALVFLPTILMMLNYSLLYF